MLRSEGPHIMLIALGENGFATRIEDSGFLRFRTIGGGTTDA
jgi:putative aminopeptidase FrvX